MSRQIRITAGDVAADVELRDSPCAEAVWAALPITASANTWGDEVYFDIGVECPLEADAREDVDVGEVGYWPTGRAVCVFFGPTPASGPDGQPRAASKVNILGRVAGDAARFHAVADGQQITLSAGNVA
jgi:hypothetical protein